MVFTVSGDIDEFLDFPIPVKIWYDYRLLSTQHNLYARFSLAYLKLKPENLFK